MKIKCFLSVTESGKLMVLLPSPFEQDGDKATEFISNNRHYVVNSHVIVPFDEVEVFSAAR